MAHVADELEFSLAPMPAAGGGDGLRVNVEDAPTPAELRLVPWSGLGPDPLDDAAVAAGDHDDTADGCNPANHLSGELV